MLCFSVIKAQRSERWIQSFSPTGRTAFQFKAYLIWGHHWFSAVYLKNLTALWRQEIYISLLSLTLQQNAPELRLQQPHPHRALEIKMALRPLIPWKSWTPLVHSEILPHLHNTMETAGTAADVLGLPVNEKKHWLKAGTVKIWRTASSDRNRKVV